LLNQACPSFLHRFSTWHTGLEDWKGFVRK
jgi:hypothetical protein